MGEPRGQVDQSRYELVMKIASGGMGSVYVGRRRGAGGFSRLVAIKRAHPHLLEDAAFKRLLLDEAHHASRLHHPNAVAVLDVEELDGELRLVMDYVEGASFADLLKAARASDTKLPPEVSVRIVLDACAGLHAAHTLNDDDGQPLGLVHRDVSPHNVLVGVDGVARLTDFGIAKSVQVSESKTATGVVRGKAGYLAPEYVSDGRLDARSDIFSLGVVLWEALASTRLFLRDSEPATLHAVAHDSVPRLSEVAPWVGEHFDELLEQALTKDPADRFASAEAFRAALEREARAVDAIATHLQVGALVRQLQREVLAERKNKLRAAGRDAETGEMRSDPAASATLAGEAGTQGALSTDMRPDVAKPRATALPRWPWAIAAAAGIGAIVLFMSLGSRDGESAPAEPPTSSIASAPMITASVSAAPAVAPGASTMTSAAEPPPTVPAENTPQPSASAAAGVPTTPAPKAPRPPRPITPPDDPWK